MPGTEGQPSYPELVRNSERRVRRLFRQYQAASDERRPVLRGQVEYEIQRLRGLRSEASAEQRRRDRLRAWFSSLSRGVKALVAAVIAAGAVATAIGAILALWPDPPQPVAELRAELTELSVDEHVTLSEYAVRQEKLEGSSAPEGVAGRQLATFSAAQPAPADTSSTGSTETETDPVPTDPVPTDPMPTDPVPTDPVPTDPVPTDPMPTDPQDDDIMVGPTLSDEAEERLSDEIREALSRPSTVPRPPLEEACVSGLHKPDCGLSSTALFIRVGDDSNPADAAKRLVEVLSDTRTERREPSGVTVNYRISLTGFRNRKVDVRWELHRPNGPPLPHAWLRNQRAALLQGEAEKDSASPHFWIPLPEDPGPFFVRLIAVDEDGDPLARARTAQFQ